MKETVMNTKRIVPIITIPEFDGIKEFYQNHFGFKVAFEGDGFLSLAAENSNELEISFMKPGNAEQPVFGNRGLTYCLEVDDVDAEYSRLSGSSVEMIQPVQDNPWGDRSFIVGAPAGVMLYVYMPITPTEEYKQYFKQ